MASYTSMPPAFNEWKRKLLDSAGSAGPPVCRLGDPVLELLWRDGCEPTISALLYYVETGLRPIYEARDPKTRPESPEVERLP